MQPASQAAKCSRQVLQRSSSLVAEVVSEGEQHAQAALLRLGQDVVQACAGWMARHGRVGGH